MNRFYFIFFALTLCSCAQIESPTGGPKDNRAPKIIKANPAIGAKNFGEREMSVEFDEYVVLNQINQEAIVSPSLSKEANFKISNKTLKISFEEELKDNTTYTINLGNGIKDFHEGVVLDSNVLVFSTGAYIDSLSFKGRVQNGFNLSPEENVLVLLYERKGDSIPSKELPYYYTKTNAKGEFSFNYLKSGDFNLFVLNDQNSNRIYDLPNEQIGFSNQRINTLNVDSNYTIKLFEPDNKKQFLVALKEDKPGKLTLLLNKPAKTISLNILGRTFKKPWFFSDTTLAGDTINIWTDIAKHETTEIDVEVIADKKILDTVSLKLSVFDTIQIDAPILNLSTNSGVVGYFNSLIINSEIPIKTFKDSLQLIVGVNDTNKVSVQKLGSKKLKINYDLEQETSYKLIIPDSFITDYFGYKSLLTVIDFKTKSDVEYANLKLRVELINETPVILQLLSKNGKVIRTDKLSKNSVFSYPNLSPSEYRLKIIFDTNNDGIWNTGKYIPRTQPERVIFFPNPLIMKAGWDKDITWTIPE